MATQTETKIKTTLKLGPILGSYANLFKPRAVDPKDEPKYSLSLLFSKNATGPEKKSLEELNKMVEFVAVQKWGPNYRKTIPKFKHPLRDGDVDKPDHKEYVGKMFANASSKRAPGIVDRQLKPVTTEDEAYSGCQFVVSVNVYAFEVKGNKGVALGLNNVLVFAKGERIDGRKEAAADFAEYSDGEPSSAPSSESENPLD